MPDEKTPTDAPPSYDAVTGSSTKSSGSKPSHLEVPGAHNGIPPHHRRSMEDEYRPLPDGWVRQWDDREQHQFFVDTRADPPRSTWVHPYDDETYLQTLTSEEREMLQEQERLRRELQDDEFTIYDNKTGSSKPISAQNTGSSFPTELPPRDSHGSTASKGKVGFGEKLKEKVTGQTKEERAKAKALREKQEREYYEAHVKFRQAMQQAQVTGKPVLFAKDAQGRDVYVEPPQQYGGGYGGGYGAGYGQNAYGYSPYQSGPYANPNARFIRPPGAYGRPYGGGYGGGYGLPLAGGLLGGVLLGGLLF